jgi:hypothetical protein
MIHSFPQPLSLFPRFSFSVLRSVVQSVSHCRICAYGYNYVYRTYCNVHLILEKHSKNDASYLFPWKLQQIKGAQKHRWIEQVISYKTLSFYSHHHWLCIFSSDEPESACCTHKNLHQQIRPTFSQL